MGIAWKMLSTLLLAALLCTASARRKRTTEAPLLAADSPDAIPNEYLVRFDPDTTNQEVAAHLNEVNELLADSTTNDSEIMDVWHIDAFRGYSVRMDNKSLDELRDMEDIMYVERNQEVETSCVDQKNAEWGLCRTTVRDWNPPVTTYSYDDEMSGKGVDVYVIDTGVYTQHNDFGGRAKWGADFVDANSLKTDPHGHGTHVAGTIAGTKYGIAKEANIIAVRVLDKKGSGSTWSIVSGIDWVVKQHKKGQAKRSLANLSLGMLFSKATNAAIKEAFEEGVIMVSAAGNDMTSACEYSPASAKGITVAASNINDALASFSNYDKECVDIVAPGANIKSLGIGGPDVTAIKSGTSMAAPHVTGVLAKYMSGPDAPSKPTYENIKQYLDQTSTKGKITYPAGITLPNSLIFMDCADSVPDSVPDSTPNSILDSTPSSAPLVPRGPFVILLCVSLSLCASMLFGW